MIQMKGTALPFLLSMLTLLAALGLSSSAASADTITDANVSQHIADAKTAAEQQEIADYFRAKAAQEGERAAFHENMLATYIKMGSHQVGRSYQQMVDHCKTLIRLAKQSQSTYLEMAEMHAGPTKSGGAS